MPTLRDCVVLHGPELTPHFCADFSWTGDTITRLDLGAPWTRTSQAKRLIMPGLYNGHTHVGDGALPDGAAGLTLEQGFFRPDGYKYRELAKIDKTTHRGHMESTLRYMARTGTVAHLDFREQGRTGAELLRSAAQATGVQSIILNQFDKSPQTDAELEVPATPLSSTAVAELESMLKVADGFSESTMNDLSDSAWQQVREITTRHNRMRAIHCLENTAYRQLSIARTGRGDLARALAILAPHLVVHMTVATPDEIALLVASETTAALNPRANATLGLPLPPITAMINAGANLLLGTDNVMLNPPNLFAELDFAYRLARSQAGEDHPALPDPVTLLKMVTSNIRPVLGADHYGYLDQDLPASFVVVDLGAPHLRPTRNLLTTLISRVGTADILATFRAGRELWRSPSFALN